MKETAKTKIILTCLVCIMVTLCLTACEQRSVKETTERQEEIEVEKVSEVSREENWQEIDVDIEVVDEEMFAEYYQFSYDTAKENSDVNLLTHEEETVLEMYEKEYPEEFAQMVYPIPVKSEGENFILYSDIEGKIYSTNEDVAIGKLTKTE